MPNKRLSDVCGKCGQVIKPRNSFGKDYIESFWSVFRDTPRSIWEMYKSDGLTIHEAIRMELSYVE